MKQLVVPGSIFVNDTFRPLEVSAWASLNLKILELPAL